MKPTIMLRGVALAALCSNPASGAVCPAGATVEGVDVSSAQGAVDWNLVAASGKAFAYARIADGTNPDAKFSANYAAIKASGMLRGGYFFFEPAQDPTAQANVAINALGALAPGDLPPALDVEITGGQSAATLLARVDTWIAVVAQATGRAPIILTASAFWNTQTTASNPNPLWIAHVGVACPTLPTSWQAWTFWLHSLSGSVPGIPGSSDLDTFNGSLGDLNLLAGQIDIFSDGYE